jgi:salicylate hydroxylase
MIHRADLHRVLIDAVRALKPMRSVSTRAAPAFEDDGRASRCISRTGEHVTGDALIGADGVHSRIRNILAGDDKAEFTGCMAWRGLVPAESCPRTCGAMSA